MQIFYTLMFTSEINIYSASWLKDLNKEGVCLCVKTVKTPGKSRHLISEKNPCLHLMKDFIFHFRVTNGK